MENMRVDRKQTSNSLKSSLSLKRKNLLFKRTQKLDFGQDVVYKIEKLRKEQ